VRPDAQNQSHSSREFRNMPRCPHGADSHYKKGCDFDNVRAYQQRGWRSKDEQSIQQLQPADVPPDITGWVWQTIAVDLTSSSR